MKPITIETLNKPVKDLARIKQKIKENQAKSKQYNSLCYDCQEVELKYPPMQQKCRRQSRKDLRQFCSPKRLIRSKSKCGEKTNCKSSQHFEKKHDIGALYGQLMAVKSEYKRLKGSYEKLAVQKVELTTRGQTEQQKSEQKLHVTLNDLERCRKVNQTLQNQLQRIRKQCLKVIQAQKFKNKKLQEIIQQKDLMISYLRNQIERSKKGNESTLSTANQSAIMFYQNMSQMGLINSLNSSNIVVDHPRCFKADRDHSKQMESISSLLTYNDAKKQCVIIQPKNQDPYAQPSQCLTFEQREQNPPEKKDLVTKMPPKQQIRKTMSKSKHSKSFKRPKLLTLGDQNTDINSKCGESVDYKLLSAYSSKQRKKTFSSRKKI